MSAVMCDKRTSARMKEIEKMSFMFGFVTEAPGRRREAKLEGEDMKMLKLSLPGTKMEPGKPDQQSLDTFKGKHDDYYDEVKSVKTPHWFWSLLVQTATQWRGGHVQQLSQNKTLNCFFI